MFSARSGIIHPSVRIKVKDRLSYLKGGVHVRCHVHGRALLLSSGWHQEVTCGGRDLGVVCVVGHLYAFLCHQKHQFCHVLIRHLSGVATVPLYHILLCTGHHTSYL